MERLKTSIVVLFFSISASSLLVVNKRAISLHAYPCSLLALQTAATTFMACVAVTCKIFEIRELRELSLHSLYSTAPIVMLFIGLVMLGLLALQHTSVDVMIFLHCLQPPFIAFFESIFYNKPYPSFKNCVIFTVIAKSCLIAFWNGMQVQNKLMASVLCSSWFICSIINQMYCKYYASLTNLTTADRVLLNNALSFPIFTAGSTLFEQKLFPESYASSVLVAISCLLGFLMSFTGWELRHRVSTLTFTLISIVNKLLSVILNVFMNPTSFSALQFGMLGVAITASALYND